MTDKKFTDEEIINIAKDCCSENPQCFRCPFDEDTITADECMGKLVEELQHKLSSCNSENAELKAEIESLKEALKDLKREMSYMSNPNTIGFRQEMGCW